MRKTELYGYGYDFLVDYDSTDVADMLNIHKYLMFKNNIKCSDLLNKYFLHYWFFVNL